MSVVYTVGSKRLNLWSIDILGVTRFYLKMNKHQGTNFNFLMLVFSGIFSNLLLYTWDTMCNTIFLTCLVKSSTLYFVAFTIEHNNCNKLFLMFCLSVFAFFFLFLAISIFVPLKGFLESIFVIFPKYLFLLYFLV